MATFSQIINKVNCGAAELLGTGNKFCKFDLRTPSVIVLLEKGLKVLPGDTFNLNATLFGRLATPIHPVMDNMFLDTQFFFLPLS